MKVEDPVAAERIRRLDWSAMALLEVRPGPPVSAAPVERRRSPSTVLHLAGSLCAVMGPASPSLQVRGAGDETPPKIIELGIVQGAWLLARSRCGTIACRPASFYVLGLGALAPAPFSANTSARMNHRTLIP